MYFMTQMYMLLNESSFRSGPGPWFNIKMLSYQYRKSHCGDKTILRPSYLHNGISYTGKNNIFILNQGPECLSRWRVSIGSGNGLVPSGNEPSTHWLDPLWSQICGIISHHQAIMS